VIGDVRPLDHNIPNVDFEMDFEADFEMSSLFLHPNLVSPMHQQTLCDLSMPGQCGSGN
jgi:hypothetical protein